MSGAVEWSDVLEDLLAGRDLDERRAAEVLEAVMSGTAEQAQVAALLTALRAKGESGAEIAGFVRAMVDHALPIDVEGPLVDTCGTGGDRAGTFNISTVAALAVAAAGARVAKHGNRAASGRCGSADLLEAWGVVIDLPPTAVARCIDELGVGFLFARTFHPAMRHVAPVRGQLGIRTVFNVLGPLSNPAGATRQVVGVSDARLAPIMADALARLGSEHALVLHGSDGLDELTTTGPSSTWEVQGGRVAEGELDPADFGVVRVEAAALRGGDVEDNVRIADQVLAGRDGPALDVVALNAGAALYVGGVAASVAEGYERSAEVLRSGAAGDLRDRWVALSQRLAT